YVTNEQMAGFATATWHVTDALSFTGGYRYNDLSKSYKYNRTDYDPNGSTNNGVPGSRPVDLNAMPPVISDATQSDYRFVVQYTWLLGRMTSAQVATGFKGGGVNPTASRQADALPYDPESVTSYEVGLKSDLFGRTLRLNLTGFYSDYEDIQLK